jgi:ABC-type lipoprotein release transport system permease subunit
MEKLNKDLRYAIRSLRKRPTFSALAVITLALGIGACTAVFSIVDGVLLRPLPYPAADRMVQLREVNDRGGQMSFAEPNFLDVRARSHTLEAVAQYGGDLETITGGSEPVRALAYSVSGDFFKVLGTQPVIGRSFMPQDSTSGAEPVVVVSYGFWQRLLGGRPDLSGTTLNISNKTFSVVGVMPQSLSFPARAEVWVPRELFPAQISRSAHNWSVIGRLRPNVTIEQARADLTSIAKQLKQENGEKMDGVGMTLFSQQEYVVGPVRSILLIITVAVVFLLAVACANVANLLLAQATARRREFAVRAALGASRLALARQFITENLVIALLAAVLGVLFSYWGLNLLISLNRQSLPRTSEISVDFRTLAFTLSISTAVAIVLGLVPLLRLSAKDLENELKDGGRIQSGRKGQRARGFLVAAQMALTLILLIGAGLLGKSFYRLLHIDPGFRTESAVAMEISLPGIELDEQQYKQFMKSYEKLLAGGVVSEGERPLNDQEEKQRLFHQQLLDRISNLPGVSAAGTINALPLAADAGSGTFLVDNNPSKTGNAEYRVTTAGYFAAMGIPLLRGRTFDNSDQPGAPHAAVISQSTAQKYWPNEDPIGRRIQFGNMDGDLRLLNIVGVVGDVHDAGIDTKARPTVYGNAFQRPASSNVTVVVRAQVPPSTLSPALRDTVRSLNPNLPVNLRTLDQVFSSSLDQRRFSLVIFGVFAAVALLLAVMGIYGVTTYSVTQRTQEIGIRIALGAQMKDVVRLVLQHGLALVLIGEVIGLAGSIALTRLMSGLLFGVTPTDLLTFISVAGGLMLVALLACYIPARRATKVDPLIALRYE